MARVLSVGGRPTFLLGVNYWSRSGGPRMWDRFDEQIVRRELRQMRAIGLNTCRSFCYVPSFMPCPPAVAPVALEHWQRFASLCQAEELATIPSFLVGHMSGENYDFAGQNGRDLYRDPELLGWQRELVRAVARSGRDQAAVVAYLASNEMPRWGGTSDPQTIAEWARQLRDALRAEDPLRPFSLGDGVLELAAERTGFDVQALRGIVDFVGPHSYYADLDPFRQALHAEYCIRSLTYLGVPVLLEEFGCSSTQASEENQRLYYREVLHACLSTGAAGALGWCFSDFALDDEAPYAHHAFELSFGVTRADGTEKPVCDELRATRDLLQGLDYAGLRPPSPVAAIVVPAYFYTAFPFSYEDRNRMHRTLLQAYQLCVAAGIEAELVPEEAIELSRYRLVLAPATQKLLAPTWKALVQHAARGNVVYWSYFGGDGHALQGAWCTDFVALTGCRHRLRYGCFDLPADPLQLEGSGLAIAVRTAVGPTPYGRAYLPLEPISADVLARDGQGQPAFVRARHGQGQLFFLNYPLEYYLAEQANVNRGSDAPQLYRLLARSAGIVSRVSSSEPVVQARVVDEATGSSLLWLINHDWEAVETTVDTPGGAPLHGTDLPLAEGQTRVALAPKQVAIYRL